MRTVRYGVSNLETERLEEFVDQWRAIYEEGISHSSERTRLLGSISDLEGEIVAEEPNKIKNRFQDLKSTASETQAACLEPFVNKIDEQNINSEGYNNRRDEVKDNLECLFEDRSEIESQIDTNGIDADAETLRSRFFEMISRTATEDAEDILEIEDVREFVKQARKELSSNSMKTEYRDEIVGSLEGHLLERYELDEKELQRNIRHLFAELADNGWPRKGLEKTIDKFEKDEEDSVEERVDTFCEIVRDVAPETTIIIPVPELPHEIAGIEVGELLIESRDAEEIQFDERFQSPFGDATEDSWMTDVEIFAKVTVTGEISVVCRRRANERLDNLIDVLNIGEDYPLSSPTDKPMTRIYFETDKNNIQPLHASKDLPYMRNKSRDDIDNKIEHFREFFNKDRDTELKKTIKNAMRWHRYGVGSAQTSESFLKLVVSLECVLVPRRGENKKSNIVKRGADALRVLDAHRDEVMDFLNDTYEIRSEIAHSAEYRLSDIELNLDLLRRRSSRILSTIAYHLDSCDDIDELLEKLKEKDLEIREARIDNSPVDPGDSFEVEADFSEQGGTMTGDVSLEVTFVDGGRFVYYEAYATDFNSDNDIVFNFPASYDIKFEFDDTKYTAEGINFLDTLPDKLPSATEEDPVGVRFYDVHSVSEADD
jgi:uncharacterized protein (UPF0335 family)